MNRTITLKLTKDVDYFAAYDTLFLSAVSSDCVWTRYVRIITHHGPVCVGVAKHVPVCVCWGTHISGDGVYEVWFE